MGIRFSQRRALHPIVSTTRRGCLCRKPSPYREQVRRANSERRLKGGGGLTTPSRERRGDLKPRSKQRHQHLLFFWSGRSKARGTRATLIDAQKHSCIRAEKPRLQSGSPLFSEASVLRGKSRGGRMESGEGGVERKKENLN